MTVVTASAEAQLLERDAELEVIGRAIAQAAEGAGSLVLIDGPPGIGKTALLDAARAAAGAAGMQTLRARGTELERGFGFGVVCQLFEPLDSDIAALLDGERPADPFAARHGLYRLAASVAGERPLAILVDDAQWADGASMGALAHIATRLHSAPIALIVASTNDDALAREAERIGTLLRPEPLSPAAAADLVRAFEPDADDDTCRACHTATAGNPFLLNELARSGADPARSPDRVTREVCVRLKRLPRAAWSLAQAAAVLGPQTALRQASELAELTPEEAVTAADALAAAGVLDTVSPPTFAQPLVGTAVYAGLGVAARSVAHSRAARLLGDDERAAVHLLHCEPAGDSWAYERLIAAARHASPDRAVTYLRRALAEPAPPQCRTELLLELATAESRGPEPAAAIPRLREALLGTLGLDRRFRAMTLLARLLAHTGRVADAVDVLDEQADVFAADLTLRRRAEAALADTARLDPTTRHRAAAVVERIERRVADGDEQDPVVLGTAAAELAIAGAPADEVAALAERAEPSLDVIRALITAERYDAARAALDAALEQAAGPFETGPAHALYAELFLRTGDLAAAEAAARRADAPALLCQVLVERGQLDAAADALGDGGPGLARGRLRLAQGRVEEAADDLRECGRQATELGIVNPAHSEWRSLLARALAAMDGKSEAARLTAEELKLARTFGAPRALAVALRAAAVTTDSTRKRVALLREATEALEDSDAQLERARAHAELGAALRAFGSSNDARESLRTAVELAHRCGAHALADDALGELRSTGARPRRRVTSGVDALTPRERRIAELAATGSQNREIAETLYVTPATVEFHLRNAYRKLMINSRRQLADALAPSAIPMAA